MAIPACDPAMAPCKYYDRFCYELSEDLEALADFEAILIR